MKRIFAMLLSLVLCLGLFAGCDNTEPTPTETEKKDYSQYAGIVEDPKTWYEEFMALPIANEDMTEDELRQLCADAFKANLSFTWTPTQEIMYDFVILDRTRSVVLPKGIAYSGLSYNSSNDKGTLWKVLDYYDPETGALDIEAMDGKHLNIIGSACTRGILWAYARVSNSHKIDMLPSINQYSSNIVPVGPYTYEVGKYSFSAGDGTKRIIADNGEQVMYESYAAMKIADGLNSSSEYHVIMCASEPVVVRWPDGTINPDESYILVHEQAAGGSMSNDYNYTQSNGVTMRPLGTVDQKYTFKKLLDKGYIPFTIKELIGEDPIEPGETWLTKGNARVEKGQDITVQALLTHTLNSNYAICNMEFQVKDPSGQVLYSYDPDYMTDISTYSVPMNNLDISGVEAYANGSNTLHLYVRLANGELIEAVNTLLKIQ